MITIGATSEEWVLIRQSLGQSVAHIGGQLAQVGMPGVRGAMQMLPRLAALDERVEVAMAKPPAGKKTRAKPPAAEAMAEEPPAGKKTSERPGYSPLSR